MDLPCTVIGLTHGDCSDANCVLLPLVIVVVRACCEAFCVLLPLLIVVVRTLRGNATMT